MGRKRYWLISVTDTQLRYHKANGVGIVYEAEKEADAVKQFWSDMHEQKEYIRNAFVQEVGSPIGKKQKWRIVLDKEVE